MSDILAVSAWGQYVHWAHQQFEHYLALTETDEPAHSIGVVAHWLAAEHVVIEGWRALGASDPVIDRIVALYPEHVDALRRCRNAVYHYQPRLLDDRIATVLADEEEQLTWAIALHFEFQRFLLHFPHRYHGIWTERRELEDELTRLVGWRPTNSPTARKWDLYVKCMEFAGRLTEGENPSAESARQLVHTTLAKLGQIDGEPLTSRLRRYPSQ